MKLDIHHLLGGKYAKWIIMGLISLFALLILSTFIQFFIFLKTPYIAPRSAKPQEKEVQNVSFILKSSLFGIYVPNDLNHIKKSMLNLTLSGILLGNSKEESQIIIRSAGGEENTFKMGDKLPGGAIIKKIMPAGVLVEHNGVLESLSLPESELRFEPVAKPLKEE